MNELQTYHVVSNEEGEVLGVYGERLLASAQEKARYIQAATGATTYLHHIATTTRPQVGQTISMKGAAKAR